MNLDPRIGFWLSIVFSILSALAAAGWDHVFAPSTAATIGFVLVTLVNVLNAVLHAIPSAPNSGNQFPLGPTPKG